jgi:hypothetical protein
VSTEHGAKGCTVGDTKPVAKSNNTAINSSSNSSGKGPAVSVVVAAGGDGGGGAEPSGSGHTGTTNPTTTNSSSSPGAKGGSSSSSLPVSDGSEPQTLSGPSSLGASLLPLHEEMERAHKGKGMSATQLENEEGKIGALVRGFYGTLNLWNVGCRLVSILFTLTLILVTK